MFLCYLVKVGLVTTLGIFAMQVYGFDAEQSSSLIVVYGVVQSLSQLSLPVLLRCMSRRTAVCIGLLCGFVAAAVPTIPGVPAWSLFVSEAMLAVPYIVYTLLTTTAGSVVHASKAGEASMLVTSAFTLSSAVGPIAFGALSSATVTSPYPGGAFLLFAVVMAVGLVLGFGLPSDEAIQKMHEDAAVNQTFSAEP